ncbi:DUF5067 domain-containing protein [Listeria costaricensis]|uniref:DUF5067 domain-containing protein n=1 Tax=Listeria costaricensis TaxID=2026604 RepID=UPI000C077B54|nr:DUF5067 domain-containing protein [Listeria costaricensis]
MKKFKNIFLLFAALMTVFSLAACGSSTEDDSSKKETAKAEKKEKNPTKLGDYQVELVSGELSQSYDGKNTLTVVSKFTNNSDKAISYMAAVTQKAFQNGVELETTLGENMDLGNSDKDVQPGASIDVTTLYLLQDTENPVDVEASELVSLDDAKVSKTFELK